MVGISALDGRPPRARRLELMFHAARQTSKARGVENQHEIFLRIGAAQIRTGFCEFSAVRFTSAWQHAGNGAIGEKFLVVRQGFVPASGEPNGEPPRA